MKHIKLLVGVIALIITVLRMADVSAQNNHKENISEFRERDEIRQTFRLAPGARVEVSSIRGSVEIETANIEVAEIQIVRSAKSRDELEQYKIGIENTPQSLTIRGETRRRNSGDGFGPDVRHQVTLRLPRRVNLFINSVSGGVRIGDIKGQLIVGSISGSVSTGAVDGQVQVNSVSGEVTIGRASGQVEIKSVSGNVNIGQVVGYLNVSGVTGNLSAVIAGLGERGIEINSVSGQVELRFKGELNAQLNTTSISGKVFIEVPNVIIQSRPNASRIRALIGEGGSPISINSVTSDVRLVQGK
jgi:hypothetical protein